MAAAEQRRRKGYTVHIYDRYDRIGGLLVYSIPNFKLEKDIVQRRVDLLEEGGVVIHRNVDVGGDLTFQSLWKKHDGILIATGVYNARDIQVAGVGLNNVIPALDFLITSNRKGLGDSVPRFEDGSLNAHNKNSSCLVPAIRQWIACEPQ